MANQNSRATRLKRAYHDIPRVFHEEPAGSYKADCNCCECTESTEFASDIGPYKAADLKIAAITVFGELDPRKATSSGTITPDIQKNESKAIASEIFNRRHTIIETRNALEHIKKQLQPALTKLESMRETLNKEARSVNEERLKEIQHDVRTINKSIADYTVVIQTATNAKNRAEDHIPGAENKSPVTIADIATAKRPNSSSAQFEGYKKGVSDLDGLKSLIGENCERQCQRWGAAKNAVREIATRLSQSKNATEELNKIAMELNPPSGERFYYNLSNDNGKRKMRDGDVRIGGNDFFNKK
ncbi:hypothetical protein WMF37_52415 [Sorangium sp. So ce291]|uniref:hypothetical protein n=1 Tax=Sorangium sp. So ce291 TaxID=3133294 RepID=UPI003F60019E